MKNSPKCPDEVAVHSILTDIKSGVIDPATLAKFVRQQCVETLTLEGYAQSALAQLFKVSDKTIQRDLKDIRERNALKPSPELAFELIGDFLQKSRVHHDYLARLARSGDASISEKVYAAQAAAQVLKDMIKTLQTLGYLPMRPQELVADFFHHKEEDGQDLDRARQQIAEMEILAKEMGNLSPEIETKLKALKLKIEQAEITREALQITADHAKGEKDGKTAK